MRMAQVAQRVGPNAHPPKPRCSGVDVDTRKHLVEEAVYAGERRVVPRVDVRLSGNETLPPFPHGRRAVLDHVAPAGMGRLRYHLIGEVCVAVPGEHVEQVSGPHDPGVEVPASCHDVPHQVSDHRLLPLLGNQLQEQAEDLGRLAAGHELCSRVRVEKPRAECASNRPRELCQSVLVLRIPQDLRDSRRGSAHHGRSSR